MFDSIPDEILNAFSIRMKIADLEKKLRSPRTPKKWLDPLRGEISRYELLLAKREDEEQPARRIRERKGKGIMHIFNLKRTRNNGTRGPRFLYEVLDANGKVIATSEQTREFVAAVVRVHTGPQGVFYSAGNFTADYTLLGKGVDKTDRSLVGAALYGRPFKSIMPRWIYAAACEYLDALPADAPRDPDATPEPAASADADLPKPTGVDRVFSRDGFYYCEVAGKVFGSWTDKGSATAGFETERRRMISQGRISNIEFIAAAGEPTCGMPGPGELYCERRANHSGNCAALTHEGATEVDTWNRRDVDAADVAAVDSAPLTAEQIDRIAATPYGRDYDNAMRSGIPVEQKLEIRRKAGRSWPRFTNDGTPIGLLPEDAGSKTPDPALPPADDEAVSDKIFPDRKFRPLN